jgi:hypothetical protein
LDFLCFFLPPSVTGDCQWELPEALDGKECCPKTADLKDDHTKQLIQAAFLGQLKKFGDACVVEKMNKAKVEQKAALQQLQLHIDGGGEHWVECYDPESHHFYYHGNHSGETTWDKPEHYVMAADDLLMSSVIKIQCGFRSREARKLMEAKLHTKGEKVATVLHLMIHVTQICPPSSREKKQNQYKGGDTSSFGYRNVCSFEKNECPF